MTIEEINKEIQIAIKAGLAEAGRDLEGDQQYIGTDKQWKEFERMKEEEKTIKIPVRHEPDYPRGFQGEL
jgi:hypothetical protein